MGPRKCDREWNFFNSPPTFIKVLTLKEIAISKIALEITFFRFISVFEIFVLFFLLELLKLWSRIF